MKLNLSNKLMIIPRKACLMLLEVGVQIAPGAELQNCCKGVDIDLKDVHQGHNVGVLQAFVDLVLPHRVAHIGCLAGRRPRCVELMHLHRDLLKRLGVKSLPRTRHSSAM